MHFEARSRVSDDAPKHLGAAPGRRSATVDGAHASPTLATVTSPLAGIAEQGLVDGVLVGVAACGLSQGVACGDGGRNLVASVPLHPRDSRAPR